MQKKCRRKQPSFILYIAFMLAVASFMGGCGSKTGQESGAVAGQTSAQTAEQGTSAAAVEQGTAEVGQGALAAGQETSQEAQAGSSQSGYQQLGEGETQFLFTVVDKDGNETQFEIYTNQEIVGDALEELGLLSGDEGGYGLYVKTVNGITADYDADGVYWAFYINDEYAQTGVDATTITPGGVYAFKVEK